MYCTVGCYDGYIYCLRAESGEVKWSLQLSREPVKSSPCVDTTTGLVWVCSHDQHLYAIHGEVCKKPVYLTHFRFSFPLCVQRGRMVHRVFLGGGSCFSSPCLDLHRGLVYAATLRGNVVAVNKVYIHLLKSNECAIVALVNTSVLMCYACWLTAKFPDKTNSIKASIFVKMC